VGFPRESRISLARMLVMVADTRFSLSSIESA
jgi:hypothetical protein